MPIVTAGVYVNGFIQHLTFTPDAFAVIA